MVAKSKKIVKTAVKSKPTIFPMGFSVSQVESSFVIIDFLDEINGVSTVIESVAIPRERAESLASALIGVFKDEESEE